MFKWSDSFYNFCKWLAIFFLPSLSTCIRMSIAEYEKAKQEQYEGKGGVDNAE